MRSLMFLGVLTLMLTGCYSVKSVKLGNIVAQNKTIEVPATGFSILDIKSALLKNGWKIKISNPNVIRNRTNPANPQIDSSNDYDAAYRLMIDESVRADSWVIGLSASIVDNRTNEEVLNMYFDSKGMGGCWPDEVAQDIVNELRSIEK